MFGVLLGLVLNPIALLLWLVVLCVIIWAARALMSAFELPQPIQTVIYVIIVLVVVLYLVQLLGGMGSPTLRIG
jgi:uncharacterized membrane protein YkvI